ncbi:MAG: AAA family ATPase [Anaerolineae bacterium]
MSARQVEADAGYDDTIARAKRRLVGSGVDWDGFEQLCHDFGCYPSQALEFRETFGMWPWDKSSPMRQPAQAPQSGGGDGHEPETAILDKTPILTPRAVENRIFAPQWSPVPISQVAGSTSPDWLWYGYLARYSYTLLLGFWKSGKSTVIAHLLKAMAEGGEFCGAQVKRAMALVVSEEPASKWAARRDELGLNDNVHLLCRPFLGKPDRKMWQEFVNRLVVLVQAHRYDLVVLDPIQMLLPVHDENDAMQMVEALAPLQGIANAGAAVLLLHHPNKSDLNEGRAARGSGALPGFVDIILEFRRFDPERMEDTRRIIKGLSRYDETPSELVVSLENGQYVALGDKGEVRQAERLAVLTDLLDEQPKQPAEFLALWPEGVVKPSLRTVERDLKELVRRSQAVSVGAGSRGNPLKYMAIRFSTARGVNIGTLSRIQGEGVTEDEQYYLALAEAEEPPC